MEVSYRKDIRHNYLVIPKIDDSSKESYCVYMLQANSIDGIIRPEPRAIDNRVLYYYDITSKQSIDTIYVKSTISYEQLKGLFTNLADLIEQAYEFLLNENDLILTPEHIYIELASCQAHVCYLPGYNNDIRKQMASLIEYLMNKVEYNDKEAVLYVYNLYAVCRDEGFCFNNLLSAIRKSKKNSLIIPKSKSEEEKPKQQIPVMMEKVSEEREQYYYPLGTYIYTGACIVGAIMLLVIGINMRIVYTSIGNRIDYGKLMALLFIFIIIIGYLMKNIWNKNKRLTKIISKHEYVDPRDEYMIKPLPIVNTDLIKTENEYTLQEKKPEDISQSKDESNYTVLLNAKPSFGICCLEPEDKDAYDVIQITNFPFVIGKLRSNVDYCLENEVVSRYHIKITREEEIYYITDLNSTNGTILNDNLLSCYQRHELTKGDKVSIAGIKYMFQI